MKTIKEFFAHPMIQMALVLGASTIILAYYSKRVFAEPLRNWELAIPAFLASLFQGFAASRKTSRFSRPWIGMLILVLATILIIVFNACHPHFPTGWNPTRCSDPWYNHQERFSCASLNKARRLPLISARVRPLIFLFLLIYASGPVTADDCLNYSDYPHWISQLETPVFAEDVLVEGNLAYLAIRTAGIIIVDITHPGHPVQIGSLGGTVDPDWTATADRLALDGNHLFVADGSGRLVHVVDVSDPTAPFPVTQIPTGIYPDGLALKGDYLYVAVQNRGVVVFDITDLFHSPGGDRSPAGLFTQCRGRRGSALRHRLYGHPVDL